MPWPLFVLAVRAVAVREAREALRRMTTTNWGVERALAAMFGESSIEYDASLMKVQDVALLGPKHSPRG